MPSENGAQKNSAQMKWKMGTDNERKRSSQERGQKLKGKCVPCYSERENGAHNSSATMKNGNWQ